MKLSVELTQKEFDDLKGWVALYRAHPELIGIPNTTWPPNGQTRIVLDSHTRQRFDEIAAQIEGTGVAPYNWPIAMLPQWTGEQRVFVDPRRINVVAIVIPTTPAEYTEPALSISVAQHGSSPSFKQVSLSRTPGDFAHALSVGGNGPTSTASVEVGASKTVKPGETIYASFVLWDFTNNVPSTDETQQGVVIGGNWPK